MNNNNLQLLFYYLNQINSILFRDQNCKLFKGLKPNIHVKELKFRLVIQIVLSHIFQSHQKNIFIQQQELYKCDCASCLVPINLDYQESLNVQDIHHFLSAFPNLESFSCDPYMFTNANLNFPLLKKLSFQKSEATEPLFVKQIEFSPTIKIDVPNVNLARVFTGSKNLRAFTIKNNPDCSIFRAISLQPSVFKHIQQLTLNIFYEEKLDDLQIFTYLPSLTQLQIYCFKKCNQTLIFLQRAALLSNSLRVLSTQYADNESREVYKAYCENTTLKELTLKNCSLCKNPLIHMLSTKKYHRFKLNIIQEEITRPLQVQDMIEIKKRYPLFDVCLIQNEEEDGMRDSDKKFIISEINQILGL